MQTPVSELLKRARAFTNGRAKPKDKIPLDPLIAKSPSIVKAITGMMAKTGCSRDSGYNAARKHQRYAEHLRGLPRSGKRKVRNLFT
jgi:hypothetical protein